MGKICVLYPTYEKCKYYDRCKDSSEDNYRCTTYGGRIPENGMRAPCYIKCKMKEIYEETGFVNRTGRKDYYRVIHCKYCGKLQINQSRTVFKCKFCGRSNGNGANNRNIKGYVFSSLEGAYNKYMELKMNVNKGR